MTEPTPNPIKKKRAQIRAELAAAELSLAKLSSPPAKPASATDPGSTLSREWVTAMRFWEAERKAAEAAVAEVRRNLVGQTAAFRDRFSPILIVGTSIAAGLLSLGIDSFVADLRNRLLTSIVIVVVMGAAGLSLRGFGELKASPKLKAAGYFVGSAAYMITAFISLLSAAKLLPNVQ